MVAVDEQTETMSTATRFYDVELFRLREDGELDVSLGRIAETVGNPHNPTEEFFWTEVERNHYDPRDMAADALGWDRLDDLDAEYEFGWAARWVELTPID